MVTSFTPDNEEDRLVVQGPIHGNKRQVPTVTERNTLIYFAGLVYLNLVTQDSTRMALISSTTPSPKFYTTELPLPAILVVCLGTSLAHFVDDKLNVCNHHKVILYATTPSPESLSGSSSPSTRRHMTSTDRTILLPRLDSFSPILMRTTFALRGLRFGRSQ